MKRFLIVIFIGLFLSKVALVLAFDKNYSYKKHKFYVNKHSEAAYQHAWCSAHHGVEEYKNPDYTRVDCLTDTNAVEFDFAYKWAESIGQALHYQLMTGKKGRVVLILQDPQNEMVYFNRVKRLGNIYNFDTEYVTQSILPLKKGKCPYSDCKCNKKS